MTEDMIKEAIRLKWENSNRYWLQHAIDLINQKYPFVHKVRYSEGLFKVHPDHPYIQEVIEEINKLRLETQKESKDR